MPNGGGPFAAGGGFGISLGIHDQFSAPLTKFRSQVATSRAAAQALTTGVKTSALRLGIAAVAVAGAGYAMHKALQPGLAFEKQMREVSAVTGATAEEFEAMTGVAKKLGIETVFSAKSAAEAMYMLGSRGVKTAKDFDTLLVPAMDLAAALKFDLVPATELMMATLKMFDMQASDATQVADLLTNAYRNSAANAEKLAVSMNYAGFAFSSVGYTLRETLVPLEALYDLGMEASMAGTSLRKAINSLIKPTTEAKKALLEMGLTTADVSPELHSFIEIIENLEKAGMSSSQAISLFGQRAGPAMSKLVHLGADSLREYDEALGTTGSASETAKEQLKGFQGALTLIKSSLEGVFIALEELLAPALEDTTRWLTEQINAFLKWIMTSEGMVKGIQEFVKAYGSMIRDILKPSLQLFKDLVTGMMTLVGTWSKMSDAQKDFVMKGVKVGTLLATLGIAVGILGPAVLGLAKAFSILGLSGGLLNLKFLLIIAAVTLLAAAAFMLRGKWKTAWEAVTNATQKCWDKIKEFVDWVREVGVVPAIIQILHTGWEWTKSVAKKFADWVWPYIEPLIKSEPVQAIIRIIHQAWDWIKSTAKKFADWIWPYIEPLIVSEPVQAVIGVVHQAWNWIKTVAQKFADWVKPFIDKLIESRPVEIVVGIILRAWEWIKSTAQNFGEWIMEQIEKLKQEPQIEINVGVILKSWNWMGTKVKTLYDWFLEQYEKGAWGKLSMGIVAITAGITLAKWLLMGAIPSLGAFLLGKLVAGGMIGAGGLFGPIGLIASVAILLWKVTPESVDKFWNFFYKELPDLLAAKIKPAVVALLDVAVAVLSWKVEDTTWTSFAWAWENKVKPALKALAPSLALVAPLFIALGRILFAPDVKEKLKKVAELLVAELGREVTAFIDFFRWLDEGVAAQEAKLKNLGIGLAGKILVGIAEGFKRLGVTVWDLAKASLLGGLSSLVDEIYQRMQAISEAFTFPISALGEFTRNLDLAGTEAIASINEISDTVGEKMGVEIPDHLKVMTLALVATESSFDRNAKAVDKLGNEYKGWGQLGKAMIKDLEKLGITVENVNDPTENLTGTMGAFLVMLKRSGGDVKKAILLYKGWGKELDKAGGDIEKLPEEAQKQLAKFLKIFELYMKKTGQTIDKGMDYAIYGHSPGGLVGSFQDAMPQLGSIFQSMLSIIGGFMAKIYDYLKTVPGLGDFLQQFEDLIKLWKTTEEKSKELIDTLTTGFNDASDAGKKMVSNFHEISEEVALTWNYLAPVFKKQEQEMLADWNDYLKSIDRDTYDTFEELTAYLEALGPEWRELHEKRFQDWKDHLKSIEEAWRNLFAKIGSSLREFAVSVATTTTSIGEAFWTLGKTIYTAIVEFAIDRVVVALTEKLVNAFNVTTEAGKAFAKSVAEGIVALGVALLEVTGLLEITANSIEVVGIRIRSATEHFETAWGTIGRSMYFTNIQVGELGRHLEETEALMYPLTEAGMEIGDIANYMETQFRRFGLAVSETVEDAQYKLEGLYQSQADLSASTTEKLINELDNYYDYRVLKEMSLDELLALSAETRVGIEQGTIQEVEESEEEQEARRRDRAVSRLQQIEDQHAKEDELIRRKIALTEIEIKFLELKAEREAHHHSERARQLEAELGQMLEAYHKSVEKFEAAEEKKQKAVAKTEKAVNHAAVEMDNSMGTVETAAEDMADTTEAAGDDMSGAMNETGDEIETTLDDAAASIEAAAETMTEAIAAASENMEIAIEDMATNVSQAIDDMATEIAASIERMVTTVLTAIETIPDEVLFDVTGILHMPSIPHIGTQYFDIFGSYHAPSIPSYQTGIPYVPQTTLGWLHPKEAVLTAPQAEEWRRGESPGRGASGTVEVRDIYMTAEFPNVNLETVTTEQMERFFDKKAVPAIKELVRQGVFTKDLVDIKKVR